MRYWPLAHRHLLERSLYMRLLLPGAIGAVMLAVALYDSVARAMPAAFIAWWFAAGALIGYVPGRMMSVRRDARRELLVLGEGQAAAIVLYMVARGVIDVYIGWVADSTIVMIDAFLLCTAGSLLGLSAGLARNIRPHL